jgi:hypothetical protein
MAACLGGLALLREPRQLVAPGDVAGVDDLDGDDQPFGRFAGACVPVTVGERAEQAERAEGGNAARQCSLAVGEGARRIAHDTCVSGERHPEV